MPAQYQWTNWVIDPVTGVGALGSGLWGSAGNWTNTITPFDHTVPGPNDTALFDNIGTQGTGTSCAVNVAGSVHDVFMNGSYTATLSLLPGTSLATGTSFAQHGALVIGAGSTMTAGTYFNISGSVLGLGMAGAPATMTTTGSFFLNATGSIAPAPAMALSITAGNFDDGGTISVMGSPLGLTITGGFTEQPAAVINLSAIGGAPSSLTFVPNNPADIPSILGTINMSGGLITTALPLKLSGTINTFGGLGVTDTIGGELRQNGGRINWIGVFHSFAITGAFRQ